MKFALALVLFAAPAFAQEQVWTWVDEKGEEHYTNDRGSIPEKFQSKAKATEGAELSVVKTHDNSSEPTPAPAPTKVAPPLAPAPVKATPATTARRPIPGGIKVVLFEAATNSASKTLSRSGVLEKLVSNNPGLQLERVEFATAIDRAERLKVNQLPTVLFVDDTDSVIARSIGLVTLKELQAQLDKARGPGQ